MHNNEIAIIYRTHYWNKDTEYLARRLNGQSIEYPFYVMCDETSGILDVSPFQKISHTNDFTDINLNNDIGHNPTLWVNGDFVFYFALKALPEAKYFVLVENDCAINFDINELISKMISEDIALAGHIYDFKLGDWPEKTIGNYYEIKKQLFFPFIIMRRDLAEDLHMERIRIKDLHRKDQINYPWPYCEAIVSSYAASNSKYRYIALSDFVDTTRYDMRPHNYMHSNIANIPNSIIHPVSGMDFLKKRIDYCGIWEILDLKSDLHKNLSTINPKLFLETLYEYVAKTHNPDFVKQFWAIAKYQNWIDQIPACNLAFAKKAFQSSLENDLNPEENHSSENAQIATHFHDYFSDGQHTGIEDNPWWQVDLDHIAEYSQIIFYSRPILSERLNKFTLSSSNDGIVWHEFFKKDDDLPIYSPSQIGFSIFLEKPQKSRFIRLTASSRGAIHIRAFEVFA